MLDFSDSVPPEFAEIVLRKARQLKRRREAVSLETSDIENSLYVKLLAGLRTFDSARGEPEALAQSIVNRQGADILRYCRAKKRGRTDISLHVIVSLRDGGNVELSQAIGQRELAARTGGSTLDPHDAAQMAQDVADVISRLPAQDQSLLNRLKWQTVAEASRETGVPASTIHSRLRGYRQAFEAAGLLDYLR